MGVTIHFEGRLKDQAAYQSVMKLAVTHAAQHGWPFEKIDQEEVTLYRVRNEEDWDYTGPVQGLLLFPDEDCDPLRLEFDRDLYVQEFVKTQFANPRVHIAIIDLLKAIEPYFSTFEVMDEGEYWESGDMDILQGHLSDCFDAMKDEMAKNPKLSGPYRLNDGRVADLIEED
jgi:hypothetical protein